MTQGLLRFDGPEYVPALDQERLCTQFGRILHLMLDGRWRTLSEIEEALGYPQASISAQLRHAKKERLGGYHVPKRRRGGLRRGLFEYRVVTGGSGS